MYQNRSRPGKPWIGMKLSKKCFPLINFNFEIHIWGIISQLPQHFMSRVSIVFIFLEFVCLVDGSLPPKVQTFFTTPFQTTRGGIFTHNVRHGIFKWHTEKNGY